MKEKPKQKHSIKHSERMVLIPESEYKLYLTLKPQSRGNEFKEKNG